MATVLAVVIFISYIGLGIPDSLFGAAWPAIYSEMTLPVSYANFITVIHATGTIISSLMSATLIKRFGTSKVTFISTLMTAAALLGFSVSDNMVWLCLSAIPLGLGAGSIDTALNNYVAVNYSARQMSFLHTSYGVGVTVSPYLMSLAIGDGNWRSGYRTMFIIQLSIAVLVLVTLPVWKKVKEQKAEPEVKQKTLSIPKALAIPKFKATLLIFIFSVAIEAVCLVFGATYLVEARGVTQEQGAGCITFYFLGMTAGRFLSGIISSKLSPKQIIIIGEGITFVALLLIIAPLNIAFATVGLFMIGLGNGPLFPNMTHLVPIHFGTQLSQSLIGLQMAASSVSVLLSPILFGQIAEHLGSHLFPYVLMLMLILTASATCRLFLQGKKSAD
ncbi:MAG: MFS transporter [Clostridia bacterium]|nr:MFS transporter [Clostridia bacterium]MBO7319031.1 MFS transporter [Clostridia bacterium]